MALTLFVKHLIVKHSSYIFTQYLLPKYTYRCKTTLTCKQNVYHFSLSIHFWCQYNNKDRKHVPLFLLKTFKIISSQKHPEKSEKPYESAFPPNNYFKSKLMYRFPLSFSVDSYNCWLIWYTSVKKKIIKE